MFKRHLNENGGRTR